MALLTYNKRDPQQFALYDAEAKLWDHRDNVHYGSKQQSSVFIDRVLASAEWRALGGSGKVQVVWTRNDSGVATCYADQNKICLPGWAVNQCVILHELAHLVTHDQHGPVFAGTALMLYGKFITKRFAHDMLLSYDQHGVKSKKRRFKYAGTA